MFVKQAINFLFDLSTNKELKNLYLFCLDKNIEYIEHLKPMEFCIYYNVISNFIKNPRLKLLYNKNKSIMSFNEKQEYINYLRKLKYKDKIIRKSKNIDDALIVYDIYISNLLRLVSNKNINLKIFEQEIDFVDRMIYLHKKNNLNFEKLWTIYFNMKYFLGMLECRYYKNTFPKQLLKQLLKNEETIEYEILRYLIVRNNKNLTKQVYENFQNIISNLNIDNRNEYHLMNYICLCEFLSFESKLFKDNKVSYIINNLTKVIEQIEPNNERKTLYLDLKKSLSNLNFEKSCIYNLVAISKILEYETIVFLIDRINKRNVDLNVLKLINKNVEMILKINNQMLSFQKDKNILLHYYYNLNKLEKISYLSGFLCSLIKND
ncbi:MAG: hypothetical protein N2505_00280 [Endomicrobia bacterium]|nr:hypothetical protein [Endomicrobiia bacterium]